MRTPTQQTRAQAHRGVALFIATLTILIAVVALAPLAGVGQPSGQPPHPGSRLQAKGSFSGSSQPSSPPFLPAVTYASGGRETFSVAIADVNGDGKPDLIAASICSVVCNTGDGWVSVLLGNGNGTFQTAVGHTSGGLFATAVAVADVNGDGKPDIVTSNQFACNGCTDGGVGVLLGNGDGTFQTAIGFSSGGSNPTSILISDVNGDGKPDVVVANEDSNSVAVLLGNGDGTFQPAVSYGSGGYLAHSIAVADVNRDGRPDLVVTNVCVSASNCPVGGGGNGSVGILLGNGDGTFQLVVTYDPGAVDPGSAAVADLNGDGKPDLVVSNLANTVRVLLGNGDGTFQPSVGYNSGGGFGTTSVAVADVNGDGKPDLVVSTYNSTVGVLLGNGDGTFQPITTYKSGGVGATSVTVKDLNGDSRPDVVVVNINAATSNSSLGVLLNNIGVKSSTSTSLNSSLNPSVYGQKVTWTATVTSSGSVTPTGKVRFTSQFFTETFTIGSATLNSGGVATLTRSNLNADSYPLTAVYLGDATNLGSTSAVLNQVVLETTSTAKLTSSPNPSTQGQAVTFTAKITSPTVIPTGPVTFTAGKTVLGTAQLSGGKASLTTSSLPVGSTKVTVTYYGDSNIAKSSASVIQTVQ
jgi:surface antigen